MAFLASRRVCGQNTPGRPAPALDCARSDWTSDAETAIQTSHARIGPSITGAMAKGTLGALATALLSSAVGEPRPPWGTALALVLVGAAGYGLSLRFYLLAQRSFGVARTGSVFAFAPLIGALCAVLLGERDIGPWMAAGGVLMLAGLSVHLTETHAHDHIHDALEHAHAHRHDDGHHDHEHHPMPKGPHSHLHWHVPLRHSHPHMPDEHHAHRH